MLARLGCRRLGDLRRLPRTPFGSGALGRPAWRRWTRPMAGAAREAHAQLTLPERFEARLELPYRVEHAPVLLHLPRACCASLRFGGPPGRRAEPAPGLAVRRHACPRREASQGELTVGHRRPRATCPRLTACWPSTCPTRRFAARRARSRSAPSTCCRSSAQNAGLLPGSHEPEERLHTMPCWSGCRCAWEPARCARAARMRTTGSATCSAGTPGLRRPHPLRPSLVRCPPGPQPTWLVEPPQPCAATRASSPWPGPHPHQAGRTHRGRLVGGTQPAATRDDLFYRSATRPAVGLSRAPA